MFIRFIQRLALAFFLLATWAGVCADYSSEPELKVDAHAQRLYEKRQDLAQRQEKLTEERDRFYNEVTTLEEPTFLEKHLWDLLAAAVLTVIGIRLFIHFRFRRRRRRRARVALSPLISLQSESVHSQAGSLLDMMGIKSSRRHRHHRSRHRRRRSHSG